MTISDHLEEIHRDFPGCEVIALADISSGLVLCVNAANTRPQEWLDRFGAGAAEALDGPLAEALRNAGEAPVSDALILTADALMLVVRSPVDPAEALCCSCTPGVDVDALIDRARREMTAFCEADRGRPGDGSGAEQPA